MTRVIVRARIALPMTRPDSVMGDPSSRINTSDDVMSPGATAILKVTKPEAAKTYRVWLVK